MKRLLILVYIFVASPALAAIQMVRVVRVIDSRTIAVENATVALRGVEISVSEEPEAIQYLHSMLDGAWVYVEDGNVYRSPDGLYINGELQRHAWRTILGMRYLGPSWPGTLKPPARSAPKPPA